MRLVALAAAGLLAGCAGPGLEAGFDAPDPGARLHAVQAAARDNDRRAIPQLVVMLDSDDPAVRMLSIRTLERMTSQTLQYDYSAPLAERRAAVARWNQWLRDQGMAPSAIPADADAPLRRSGPASGGSNPGVVPPSGQPHP